MQLNSNDDCIKLESNIDRGTRFISEYIKTKGYDFH